MSDCIFCKIASGEIPGKIIHKDHQLMAFYDVQPKASVHFLIIPLQHITSMLELEEKHSKIMGDAMILANKLAKEHSLDGYKVQVNTGASGGQEVFHLHIHVMGNKS